MNSLLPEHAMLLAAVLLVIGAVGVIARRNLLIVLMSVEIMLNAASVAFVAAAAKWGQPDGQVMVVLILVVAAAEVAVGLALLLRVARLWKDVDSDEVTLMKG